MNHIIEMQKRILPELVNVAEKRYLILYTIYYNQPIGRRLLSSVTGMTERVIRDEVDILKGQGLISISGEGMRVTKDGVDVLESLRDFIHDLKGLPELEKQIRDRLCIKNITIVPGDVGKNHFLLNEMGKKAANILTGMLHDDMIIAVAGGSSVAALAEVLSVDKTYRNLMVVPARGGLGREVEFQANTITATLSKKLNANYRFLHIPDDISSDALKILINEQGIRETIDYVKRADVLIYGIGRADVMAKRRHLSDSIKKLLNDAGAVAETMGYYFNINGQIVYTAGTISLDIDELLRLPHKLAISGGASKAEAILASCRVIPPESLIIDEGAARRIIELINSP
ncbi:sugar-binding transcriptional regulator [Calorimonas adulescens]|uniref:Sugar-binding transcriptional regulator n=1 Tax=Calorimonas adulescens TaxID=2606906 RepID=A0A5D8QAR8_9THEO|nr:sugar-binding domain-containing protein [Calorimonas adulescens]TZE81234.1 sugar-binding transcriptional regulator [Calorimonas adulescens]